MSKKTDYPETEHWNGNIEKDLLRKARMFAKKNRRTVTSIINLALEQFFNLKN